MDEHSFSQIFRRSLPLVSTTFVTVVAAILRNKLLASRAGPEVLGEYSLLQSLNALCVTIAGCGIGQALVRFLASSADENETSWLIHFANRRARVLELFGFGLGFGSVVLGVVELRFSEVPIVLIGFLLGGSVVLAIRTTIDAGILTGLGRLRELSRVNRVAALALLATSAAAISFDVPSLPVALVLLACLAPFVPSRRATAIVCRKIRSAGPLSPPPNGLHALGFSLTFSSLAMNISYFIVRRTLSIRDPAGAGYYSAAWNISAMYLSLLLSALALEYFPRLTRSLSEGRSVSEIVNAQARYVLLFGTPVVLLVAANSSFAIRLLYGEGFRGAEEVLRWHLYGDVLKLAAWPFGFIFLAMNKPVHFTALEAIWSSAYVVFTAMIGQASITSIAAARAFSLSYLILLALNLILAKKLAGLVMKSSVTALCAGGCGLVALIHILSRQSSTVSLVLKHAIAFSVVISYSIAIWIVFSGRGQTPAQLSD